MYTYRCLKCEKLVDFKGKLSVGPTPKKYQCPVCGCKKLERVWGKAPNVLYKSGGFYQTEKRVQGNE